MNDWLLDRAFVVAETAINSSAKRRTLQGAEDAFTLGQKRRLGPDGVLLEALRRSRRFKGFQDALRTKQVTPHEARVVSCRFMIVYDPQLVEREQLKRNDVRWDTELRFANLFKFQGAAHSKMAWRATCGPTRPSGGTSATMRPGS
ncbi:MAG: hypothetical protein U5K81_12825 [Trueperaceae bacterium]|nr:hypothetical protein [Trueperaceae bacterium]